MNRRQLLRMSGLVAGGGVVAACSNSGGKSTSSELTWWDHMGARRPLHERIFAAFPKQPGGMRVQYTFRNASKMGQALQLAKQSNQLPDVHTNAGLQLPVPQLIAGGYVGPLDLSAAAMKWMKPHLVDGIHIFDGKVYSFPIVTFRTYQAATWFNTDLIGKAGLDPAKPPRTYDEFRSAARTVHKRAGGAYGWVWNVGMPPRMEAQVHDLAQAAGFAGGGGTLYRTGEFAFHADEYVNAVEFLGSMSKDGLLMPGATSFSDQIARARWASGSAGYYIDGPWCPGVVKSSFPSFLHSIGVGPILVPEARGEIQCYSAPASEGFWVTPDLPAKKHKAANLLLSNSFAVPSYFTGEANIMSNTPLNAETIVAKSDAYSAYKTLTAWMAKQVFLAPTAVVGNIDVNKVEAETNPVKPALGDIVQGVFSGDVTDIKKALKQLSDKSSAERDRALKAARAKGAKVSADDYAFSNWKPGADYSTDMYQN